MSLKTVKALLKIEYLDGIYQGQTIQGRYKQGIGVYLWDNGCCYIGEWKADQVDGEGVIFIPPQTFVHGMFVKDKLNGPAFIKTDEWVFEGYWVQGLPDGVIYARRTDLKYERQLMMEKGQFKSITSYNASESPKRKKIFDQLSSVYSLFGRNPTNDEFTMGYKEGRDGIKYLGVIDSLNMPNGLGVKQHSNGFFDCGQFQEGLLQGSGRVQYQDGQVYQGGFHRDQYQNEGVLIYRVTNSLGQSHIEYISGLWAYGYISNTTDRGVLDDKKALDRSLVTVKYTFQKGDSYEKIDIKTKFPLSYQMIKDLENMMDPAKLRQLSPERLRLSSTEFQNSSKKKQLPSDKKQDQDKQYGYNQQKTLIYLNQIYLKKGNQQLPQSTESKIINEDQHFSNTLNSSKNNERPSVETLKQRKISCSNIVLTPETKKQKYIKSYYQSLLDKNQHLNEKNQSKSQTKKSNTAENQQSQKGENICVQIKPSIQSFSQQKPSIQKIREQVQKPYQLEDISPVKPAYKQPFHNKHMQVQPQQLVKKEKKKEKSFQGKKQPIMHENQIQEASKKQQTNDKEKGKNSQQNIRIINPHNSQEEYFTQPPQISKHKLNQQWKSEQGLDLKSQSQTIDIITITPRNNQAISISQSKVTPSRSVVKNQPIKKFQPEVIVPENNNIETQEINTKDIPSKSPNPNLKKQKSKESSSRTPQSQKAKISQQTQKIQEIQTGDIQNDMKQNSDQIGNTIKPESILTIQDHDLQFKIVSQQQEPSQRETAFERQLRQEFEINMGQKSDKETASTQRKEPVSQERVNQTQQQEKIQQEDILQTYQIDRNKQKPQVQLNYDRTHRSNQQLQTFNLTPTVFQPKATTSHIYEYPVELKKEQTPVEQKSSAFEKNQSHSQQTTQTLILHNQKMNQQIKVSKPESVDDMVDGNHFLSSEQSKNDTVSQMIVKTKSVVTQVQPEYFGLSSLQESINQIKQMEEQQVMDQLAWKYRSQSPHSLESEQGPHDTLQFMSDVQKQLKDQNEQIRSLAQVVKDAIKSQKIGKPTPEQAQSKIEISKIVPFILPCNKTIITRQPSIVQLKHLESRIYITPTVQPTINHYPYVSRQVIRSLSPRVTPQIYVQPQFKVLSRTRLKSPREILSRSFAHTTIIQQPQLAFQNLIQLPQHSIYFKNH